MPAVLAGIFLEVRGGSGGNRRGSRLLIVKKRHLPLLNLKSFLLNNKKIHAITAWIFYRMYIKSPNCAVALMPSF